MFFVNELIGMVNGRRRTFVRFWTKSKCLITLKITV